MFKFFKRKKSLRDKVFEAVEGKLHTPYYFTSSYKPQLTVYYEGMYGIHYKGYKTVEDISYDLYLEIDSAFDNKLSVTLKLNKKTFINLKEDIINFLHNVEEYFNVIPCCIIIDGEKVVELMLSEIDKINEFLKMSDKIVIVTKTWIENQDSKKLLETLGKMAIYEKYKSYSTYKDLLILSDSVLIEDRLNELYECLDINLPISELEEVLLEKQFELLEVF